MKVVSCFPLLLLLAACSTAETPAPTPSVEVETALAQPASITATLTVYGTAEFDPAATRAIPVEFEARVRRLLVAVGQSVDEGAPLLALEPSASSRLELGRLEREARSTAAELARLTRLREDDLASNAEVETARAAAETAAAAFASLSARASGGPLLIRAPRAGVVDALPFAPGDLAAAGSIIARIGDPGRLQVRLGLEAEDLRRARTGQQVEVVALRPGAVAGSGHIVAIDRRLDPQTRLAGAIAELEKNAAVLAGEPVRATLALEQHDGVLVVPRSAILYEAGKPYLFTVEGGTAKRHEVALGIDDGARVEVSSGLAADAAVVVRGNYELSDGAAVRAAGTTAAGSP